MGPYFKMQFLFWSGYFKVMLQRGSYWNFIIKPLKLMNQSITLESIN